MKAVINAGGKGTRLRPYTFILPKPLVPVGEIPVIEILFQWLRRSDVTEVYITTGYLSHLIQAVCGDGSKWDMSIHYVHEDKPLSTVAPLQLIGAEKLNDTFLMLNGDIITDLNLRDFISFHKSHNGILSIAYTQKTTQSEFGVLEVNQNQVTNFKEKPKFSFPVSMGVYCLEPSIFEYIPKNVAFGFDDLMYSLIDKNIYAYAFEHAGLWMDIGRPEDYQKAQDVFAENSKGIIGI